MSPDIDPEDLSEEQFENLMTETGVDIMVEAEEYGVTEAAENLREYLEDAETSEKFVDEVSDLARTRSKPETIRRIILATGVVSGQYGEDALPDNRKERETSEDNDDDEETEDNGGEN